MHTFTNFLPTSTDKLTTKSDPPNTPNIIELIGGHYIITLHLLIQVVAMQIYLLIHIHEIHIA